MIRNLVCSLIAATTLLTIGLILSRPTPPQAESLASRETSPAAIPITAGDITPEASKPLLLDNTWDLRLRERRTIQLTNLSTYASYGYYPTNSKIPGRAPVFVDDKWNVPCAVAHLMHASQRNELVDAIRLTDNNMYISSIHDGPAMDWILTSGLTREECALIQPTYRRRLPKRSPDAPPLPEELVHAHLVRVHKQLVESTESSLEVARQRLAVRLQKGPLDEACDRQVHEIHFGNGQSPFWEYSQDEDMFQKSVKGR